MKNCTTIEQSRKLIKAKLDPDTSDMTWNVFADGTTRLLPKDDWDNGGGVEMVPAWTTDALLDIVPESLDNEDYWLIMEKNMYEHPSRRIEYSFGYEHYNMKHDRYERVASGATPCEAAYNLVMYLIRNQLIDNKYIK